MTCPHCKSTHTIKNGSNRDGSVRLRCRDCLKSFGTGQIFVKKNIKPFKELTTLEKYQRKFEFYKTKVDISKISAIKEKHKNYRENKDLILEIELVPSSCWWTNIRSNVKESEWNRIRFVTGGLADFKCEICGERGTRHPVECHEVWVYNERKKTQTLLKFQCICPLCHITKHLGLSLILDSYERSVERFTELNNLTSTKAKKLIDQTFKQHKVRSRTKWKLDISLLSNYNIILDKIDREEIDYDLIDL